jgi:hypothetical protein
VEVHFLPAVPNLLRHFLHLFDLAGVFHRLLNPYLRYDRKTRSSLFPWHKHLHASKVRNEDALANF